ncbi:MAG TPA: 3-phosphoshikimate 1-carboxyvinyltransferase [Longimicrobiales bacterium]|nr:3-phosphoshikimate 1-carboxyvinyltransferase [Longimicrobiales bacterium]
MRIRVPGDKSITQRALVFAALAEGESRLSGLLRAGDAASTATALRLLGAELGPLPRDGGDLKVPGLGLDGLSMPSVPLDLGNSGTGSRLLLGVLAGLPLTAEISGDESLRGRPMGRVTEPLSRMGARFEFLQEPNRLPLRVTGTHPLSPLEWESPVPSAQVKSALLLAGLTGGASVVLSEPRQSRDHTERMMELAGVTVVRHAVGQGWRIVVEDPPRRLEPLDFAVPGDPSSAAFLLALAALGGAGDGIEIEGVGLNPTRTAYLELFRRMGAGVESSVTGSEGAGEPSGTLVGTASSLKGVTVTPDEVPGVIDELPLIAVLAARAEGETTIRGAQELRHKESDRITTVVRNLRALGAEAEELADGLVIQGSDRPLAGKVITRGDHRIAMAFGVLGAVGGNRIGIDDPDAVEVSFPGFWDLLRAVRKDAAR